MPVDPRLKAQIEVIKDGHSDAAIEPEDWERADRVDYIYRRNTILARDTDETVVMTALAQILRDEGVDVPEAERPFGAPQPIGNVLRITLPAETPLPVPVLLDRLDPLAGMGKARPDHLLYVCPRPCPSTEPVEVPAGTVAPVPPPGPAAPCCGGGDRGPRCDGGGVLISVLDTGLLKDAWEGHPWLAGVDGVTENPYGPDGTILSYAGHGTFVAGVARCMAPHAAVRVEKAFDSAAAKFETDLVPVLEDALEHHPDILDFTFTTPTRHDQSLLTFDDFYDRRIRHVKGLVVVAPAGNEGKRQWMWPAAYPWVVSVGALSASWRDRAPFSNYGGWVDVYAPGEDLVNAFASGTYVCKEPPAGQHRVFHGMARWSGTSFSTPVVAGMIAARMSATGENGREAADSLLRLARSQAVPGVGAVLYPGQACCEPGHWRRHGGPACEGRDDCR
jgi:hypothetical protein